MSGKKRNKHDSSKKLKVALEAIKEEIIINEIASKYEIHPGQVRQWKKEFLDNADKKKVEQLESEKDDLENLIG